MAQFSWFQSQKYDFNISKGFFSPKEGALVTQIFFLKIGFLKSLDSYNIKGFSNFFTFIYLLYSQIWLNLLVIASFITSHLNSNFLKKKPYPPTPSQLCIYQFIYLIISFGGS